MRKQFSLKRLLIALFVIFSVTVASGLIYKSMDEKLTEETVQFFTIDPQLEPDIKTTYEFFKLVDLKTKNEGLVFSKDDAQSFINNWEKYLKEKPQEVEAAEKMFNLNRLVFSRHSIVESIKQINQARDLRSIFLNQLYYLKVTGKKSEYKEGLLKAGRLSLNTSAAPNQFLGVLISMGITTEVFEELNSQFGKASLKEFEEAVNNLNIVTITQTSKQADAIMLINSFKNETVLEETFLGRRYQSILHFNKLMNKMASRSMSGEKVEAQDLDSESLFKTPDQVINSYEVLFFSRMADSEQRIEIKINQLKAYFK